MKPAEIRGLTEEQSTGSPDRAPHGVANISASRKQSGKLTATARIEPDPQGYRADPHDPRPSEKWTPRCVRQLRLEPEQAS